MGTRSTAVLKGDANMPGLHDAIQTANALTRTLLSVTVVGAVVLVGWKGYGLWQDHRQQTELAQVELAAKSEELARQAERIAGLQAELAGIS